jgi:hypothetical protein
MMDKDEALERIADIRADLQVARVMYRTQVGPEADLYRAVVGLTDFIEAALS